VRPKLRFPGLISLLRLHFLFPACSAWQEHRASCSFSVLSPSAARLLFSFVFRSCPRSNILFAIFGSSDTPLLRIAAAVLSQRSFFLLACSVCAAERPARFCGQRFLCSQLLWPSVLRCLIQLVFFTAAE
jgi:hypothetical protein